MGKTYWTPEDAWADGLRWHCFICGRLWKTEKWASLHSTGKDHPIGQVEPLVGTGSWYG